MEKFLEIVKKALEKNASDIHLLEKLPPQFRINRELYTEETIEPMNKFDLESLMETIVGDDLDIIEQFEREKRIDLPYDYSDTVRLRINASMSNKVPAFSIRIIKNNFLNVERFRLKEILNKLKNIDSGLILITGKVNSGKTTTLNALVEDINQTTRKKIVMLEEPIEYIHKSNKCIIVQKEVGPTGDIPSYYDGVINLLREDADISIIGEIRDRKTMDAVLDLAESGGVVIGTLHTRSCSETIDRILGMYEPKEQTTIKYSLSNVLKTVISQKLVKAKDDSMILVPEVMTVNSTISALIRQERFSLSEIKDAIHHSTTMDNVSFERSFAKLYKEGVISMGTIRKNTDDNSIKLIDNIIGGDI